MPMPRTFFEELDQLMGIAAVTANKRDIATFPKHDVERISENHVIVSLALAGYNKKDIDIQLEYGPKPYIHVKYQKPQDAKETRVFIHKGIAERNFDVYFNPGAWFNQRATNVSIESATMKDGMLRIEVKGIIPEELATKKITIAD